MITTLEPWQIVVLIVLILSLAVILRRLAILTALVVNRHWSKDLESVTSAGVLSLENGSSSESARQAKVFKHLEPEDQWIGTAVSPSGVSYIDYEPPTRRKVLGGRKKHY